MLKMIVLYQVGQRCDHERKVGSDVHIQWHSCSHWSKDIKNYDVTWSAVAWFHARFHENRPIYL